MQPGGMPAQFPGSQSPPSGWSPSTPSLDELHSDFNRLAVPELQDLVRCESAWRPVLSLHTLNCIHSLF